MRRLASLLLSLLIQVTAAYANWWPDYGRAQLQPTFVHQAFRFDDADLPDGRTPQNTAYEHEVVVWNKHWSNLTFPRFWRSDLPDNYLDCGPQSDNDNWAIGTFRYPTELGRFWSLYIALQPEQTDVSSRGQINAQIVDRPFGCYDCYCIGSFYKPTEPLAYFNRAPQDGYIWHGSRNCSLDTGSLVSMGDGANNPCWHFEDYQNRAHRNFDNLNQAEIHVEEPGDYWGVQIWQPVTLQADKWYRLSQVFDADQPMDIWVSMLNVNNEEIGLWEHVQIHGTAVPVTFEPFTLRPDRTHDGARLVYAVGEDAGTCMVSFIHLQEVTHEPPPECDKDPGSLIGNGAFDGSRCWSLQDPDHRAAFDFASQLHGTITPGSWHSVLVSQPISLVSGVTYAVFFDVHGTHESTITIGCEDADQSGQVYGLWQDIRVGPTQRRVWEVFTSTATDADARFLIAMGAVSGEIWIDNVVVRRVQCNRDPGQLLGDPNFDTLDCWRPFHYPKPNDQFGVETDDQGARRLVVTSSGEGQFWHTQLYQPDVPIERGKRYLLSQTIETDRPMDIFTAVANGNNQVLGGWDSLHVTPGPAIPIESMAFTVAEDASVAGAKVVYSLGKNAGTCKIGQPVLQELHCERDPGGMIGDGQFDGRDCWIFQHRMLDRFTVERDSEGRMAAHIVSSAPSESVWVTQIRQENLRLRKDKKYYLHAEVKTATPGGLLLAQLTIPGHRPEDWNALFYADSLSPLNQYQVIDTVLTTPADTDSAQLSFAFGNTASHSWVRDVRLEERENCYREIGDLIASPGFEKAGCWDLPSGGEITDGVAHVSVAGSEDPWSVTFGQGTIVLANRWRYRLSFRARCSRPATDIQLYLGMDPGHRQGNVLLEGTRTLGTDWETFEVSGYSTTNSANAHLTFGLGATEADYYFQDIHLAMVPDEERDKYKQPFARESIWNKPIGDGAAFAPCAFGPSQAAAIDADYWIVAKDSDPERTLYDIPSSLWLYRRCNDRWIDTGVHLPFPDSVVVRDVIREPYPQTPNNSTACLKPDGRTIVQWNAICRDTWGGDVWGVPHRDRDGVLFPDEDIYGLGIKGCHGGSGLSSIGGTIRCGELISAEPIRHALKVDIDDDYMYGGPGSFRWPAWKSDGNWDVGGVDTLYSGTNPQLCMGSLLAIPLADSSRKHELETPVAKKLFDALLGYGAYVVDNAAWDCYYFCAENGVREEAEAYFGHSIDTMQNTPYHRDVNRLFSWLHVVANNDSLHVGGGGTPIAEWVEELIEEQQSDSTGSTAQPRLTLGERGPTAISFAVEMPETCQGELRVYDVGGRLVAEIFKGSFEKGLTSLSWHLNTSERRVASGIYFARLRTDRGSRTIRVPIVR